MGRVRKRMRLPDSFDGNLNTDIFLIPGYNYCGPFNGDFSKVPVNELDAKCRAHDIAYTEMGSMAYVTWNLADERLINWCEKQLAHKEGLTKKYISEIAFVRNLFMVKHAAIDPEGFILGASLEPLEPEMREGLFQIKSSSNYRYHTSNPFVRSRTDPELVYIPHQLAHAFVYRKTDMLNKATAAMNAGPAPAPDPQFPEGLPSNAPKHPPSGRVHNSGKKRVRAETSEDDDYSLRMLRKIWRHWSHKEVYPHDEL